jgi:hypothetical protein
MLDSPHRGGGMRSALGLIELVTFLSIPTISPAGQPVSFNSPVVFSAGNKPSSVTTGDFNHDGNLDLAVADAGGSNITIRLGNGKGGFSYEAAYTVGSGPASIVTGDFNGDGKLDLAVAIEGVYPNWGSTVAVLMGNGDGTFQAPVSYAVGTQPDSVAVGDFNRDGKLDLAVISVASATVSILVGNGNGTFRPAQFYSAGSFADAVAVGDFNGDGKPDLAISNSSVCSLGDQGYVSILLGNGDGTFQPPVGYVAGEGPIATAVADFNGDGKPDLAVVNNCSSDISIFIGNGDGTFQSQGSYFVYPNNPTAIAVGDFNGDGKPDLAVIDSDVSILLGNGDGTFQLFVSYWAGEANSAAVGDFTSDGKPDLVLTSSNNMVVILAGNGNGAFQQPLDYTVFTGNANYGSSWVAYGDFNRDGKLDLVVSISGFAEFGILLGNGDGTFQPAMIYGDPQGANSVTVGDFMETGSWIWRCPAPLTYTSCWETAMAHSSRQ